MSYKTKKTINKKFIKYVSLTLILIILITAVISRVKSYKPDLVLNYHESANNSTFIATSTGSSIASSLFAKYACLMDAQTGRILIGKNAYTQVPMASTTKIMTCTIALEYGDLDFTCTTSSYAASMPDVQLNLKKKDAYPLKDLLYSLMLQSHNDSAVVIAENVAYQYLYSVKNNKRADILGISSNECFNFVNYETFDSTFISNLDKEQSKLLVKVFTSLMNHKATELGCTNTYFITPNGLDASENNKVHSTTARDLSIIMSYCIQNKEFLAITQTPSYTFGKYSFSNANKFLNMYNNIISGKTGFTNDAGYCYVCAYKDGEKTFIVSLLACGWPNNKTYKWQDSKKMLNYARENYNNSLIVKANTLNQNIRIEKGLSDTITITNPLDYSLLISPDDKVDVSINIPQCLTAPVYNGQQVGSLDIYVNEELHKSIPLYSSENIEAKDTNYYIKYILNRFLFIDK